MLNQMIQKVLLAAVALLMLSCGSQNQNSRLTDSANSRGAGSVLSDDKVGNGGGLVETEILYAYLNLEKFIRIALVDPDSELKDSEQVILQEILDSLKLRKSKNFKGPKEPVQFLKNFENLPGADRTRVFWTGLRPTDPIYVNASLLYREGHSEISAALDLPAIAGQLTHELGHQLGLGSEYEHFLHLLGAKVENSVAKQIIDAPMPDDSSIRFSILVDPLFEGRDRMLLLTSSRAFEISEPIDKRLNCSSDKNAYLRPLGLHYKNPHWLTRGSMARSYASMIAANSISNSSEDEFEVVQLELDMKCPGRTKSDFQLAVALRLPKNTKDLSGDDLDFELHHYRSILIDCQFHPGFCD